VDALQFFLLRHEALRSPTATQSMTHLLSNLSEAQLRHRPRPDLNSIAWIVWHMARAEDFGAQRLVGHRSLIFDQEEWMARLNVPLRHCGTAMTDEEVSDLSARIDLAALRDYWAAVGRGTLAVVHTLHPDELDEVVDPGFLHQVIVDEGVFGPNTDFIEPFYRGHNKGWFLAHLGLTHNYEHAAEALVIRGLLGFRRP
jgi:hypothetical protein